MKKIKCKLCDKTIPVARLKALPKTELCIKCSEKESENDKPQVDVNSMVYHAFFD